MFFTGIYGTTVGTTTVPGTGTGTRSTCTVGKKFLSSKEVGSLATARKIFVTKTLVGQIFKFFTIKYKFNKSPLILIMFDEVWYQYHTSTWW